MFALSFGIERMRPADAQLLFWLYAALVGVSLGSIFMVYTQTSVVRVFFITAASFGALSLWGYTTQRDLTGARLVSGHGPVRRRSSPAREPFSARSSALQWVISVVGVLVFSGLTAWDTQRLKNEYIYVAMDGDTAERSRRPGRAVALSRFRQPVHRCCCNCSASGTNEPRSRAAALRAGLRRFLGAAKGRYHRVTKFCAVSSRPAR